MSNFKSFGPLMPALTGTAPQIFIASTPDNGATITAPGYLNDLAYEIKANDVFFINYSDNSTFPLNPGLNATPGQFLVIVSGGNTSLTAFNPNILPVTIDPQGNMAGVGSLSAKGPMSASFSFPGVANEINVVNTSSAAGSDACFNAMTTSNMSGTTGGSPYINFVQLGFQQWRIGLWSIGNGGDNNLHLSPGTPTANDPLIFDFNTTQLLLKGNVVVENTIPGNPLSYIVKNDSSAAGSGANLRLTVMSNGAGTQGGSPGIIFFQEGFQFWQTGLWSVGDGGDNNYHIASGNYSSTDPIIVAGSGTVLTVNGETLINGELLIDNDSGLTINTIDGTTTLSNDFSLAGDAVIGGNLTVNETTTLNDTTEINANTTINGDLTVTGTITNSDFPYLVSLVLYIGGASTTYTFPISGALDSDLGFAQARAVTNAGAFILSCEVGIDEVTVLWNIAPGDSNFQLQLYRL